MENLNILVNTLYKTLYIFYHTRTLAHYDN